MNTKTILGTVGVAVALVLGVTNLFGSVPTIQVNVPPANPTPVQVNVPRQEAPTVNVSPAKVTVEAAKIPASPILGAQPGPDAYHPYFGRNDVREWVYSSASLTSTSTPCTFKLPSATSTISWASFQSTTATTAATTWVIATSTLQNATTTNLGSISIAANVLNTLNYIGAADDINAPSIYVSFGVQGGLGDATMNRGAGVCKLIVREN